MSYKYILNGDGEPEMCDDLMVWGRWMGNHAQRIVAKTKLPAGSVSTVFLGIDHRYKPDAPLELFETMVFGGHHDQHQERYATRAEAVAGHARVVAMVEGTVFP